MPIQLGNTNITKAYLGATEVTQAYLGDVLVFGGAVSTDFIITIKTDNSGTSLDTQFTFPITTGTCDIDWGDGNTSLGVSGNQTHTYSVAGTYDISVTGGLTRTRIANGGDPLKLIDVKNWGDIAWGSNQFAMFNGCSNLIGISATDIPDFSSVNDMSSMFRKTGLTSISLVGWNTENVVKMSEMFRDSTQLSTIDLTGINTSKLENFSKCFYNVKNCNIIGLNDIDTSKVTNISQMFTYSNWDGTLANWDITSLTSASNFRQVSSAFSTINYDAILISWASQAIINSVSIGFFNSKYTLGGAAEAARDTLINTYGWTITDGGGI
jgi:hypothetical protein